MRIESGPKTERIVRNSIFFLMTLYGLYFLYDGYWGYEAENFEEHLQALEPAERETARSARRYPNVNTKQRDELVEKAERVVSKLGVAAQRAEMEAAFGGPPSYESPSAVYYFGPDFRLKFAIRNGSLREPVGSSTAHKMTDLRWQKMIGWGMLCVSIASLVVIVRVLMTRCVLDDNGLAYRFKGRATWDEMKSLESSRFLKKGWVDLVCSKPGAGEQRIRLDEYHLKHFPEIIAEICSRKGFEDPVAKEREMKARQAAASQAGPP